MEYPVWFKKALWVFLGILFIAILLTGIFLLMHFSLPAFYRYYTSSILQILSWVIAADALLTFLLFVYLKRKNKSESPYTHTNSRTNN